MKACYRLDWVLGSDWTSAGNGATMCQGWIVSRHEIARDALASSLPLRNYVTTVLVDVVIIKHDLGVSIVLLIRYIWRCFNFSRQYGDQMCLAGVVFITQATHG